MTIKEDAVEVLRKAIEQTVDAGLLAWALSSDMHKDIAVERLEELVKLGLNKEIPRSSIEASKVVVDKMFDAGDEKLKRNTYEKWGANKSEI